MHYDAVSKGAKAYERLAEELLEAVEHPMAMSEAAAAVPEV
jgi:hypothetical protein